MEIEIKLIISRELSSLATVKKESSANISFEQKNTLLSCEKYKEIIKKIEEIKQIISLSTDV